jgi:hypothetical protein
MTANPTFQKRTALALSVELLRLDPLSEIACGLYAQWRMGRDTSEIAAARALPESLVYNTLHAVREVKRERRAMLIDVSTNEIVGREVCK